MTNRGFHFLSGAAILLLAAFSASSRTSAQAGAPTSAVPATTPFAITYKAGPKWRAGVPMRGQGLRDHFYYWKRLHEEGRVIAAGQLGADGGLVLLHASDQADADRVINADPAVLASVFTGEARPFIPRFVGSKPLKAVAP